MHVILFSGIWPCRQVDDGFVFSQKHKFDGMVLEVWSQLGGHYKR